QVAKDIEISSSVNNTGDILTDGKFTSKDVKNTKSLIAKDKIEIGNLENNAFIATDSSLNVKGTLTNTKDIKVNKEINVAFSTNNSGEIVTNASFSAQDTVNTNKLIAVDKITVKNLTNDGDLTTNNTLTVDGTLKNTKNIQANNKILISSSADNSGNIL
ncbi:hypothetical protein, partial [Fusobacterium necrophorum]|uniref:hypothetical protein n=1 Tax=Fusobacterium necrophorum TaxID=859 RepID=UPI00164D4B04